MSDLEDTFGADFADHVQERVQQRRAERERISDETKKAIANLAINEDAFKGGDPMFEYTTEEGVTHNVLLMQLAQPRDGSVWSMVNPLDSGGVSVPLDYLGEWLWSIFNDPDMAKTMEEGEWYIVVGNLSQWEPDDGPARDQIAPVRGIIGLEEAKQLADASMDEEGLGGASESEEEQPESDEEAKEEALGGSDEEEDEEEDEEPSKGIFGGGGDEDEEPEEEEDDTPIDTTYGEVASVVEELADEEEEVWEVHEDHAEYETFILVVCDKLGLDATDEKVKKAVGEMALDRVDEGPRDDGEDDETDSLF